MLRIYVAVRALRRFRSLQPGGGEAVEVEGANLAQPETFLP